MSFFLVRGIDGAMPSKRESARRARAEQGTLQTLKSPKPMTRQQVLDLYFLDARSKLIDLAAFLDRVDGAEGEEDFRMNAFRQALFALAPNSRKRAKQALIAFSDPTAEPIATAPGKGATGAWPGKA
jgi:hypothetical protein